MDEGTVKIQTVTTYEMTPRQIAEAFSDLDSRQMMEFFDALAEITDDWPSGGGMMWYYLRSHYKERQDTRWDDTGGVRVIRDMSAPFYIHWDWTG